MCEAPPVVTRTVPKRTAAKGKAKACAKADSSRAAKKEADEAKAKAVENDRVKNALRKAPTHIKDYFKTKDGELKLKLREALSGVKKSDFSNVEAVIQEYENKSISTDTIDSRR